MPSISDAQQPPVKGKSFIVDILVVGAGFTGLTGFGISYWTEIDHYVLLSNSPDQATFRLASSFSFSFRSLSSLVF